jgi:hypothetical protein
MTPPTPISTLRDDRLESKGTYCSVCAVDVVPRWGFRLMLTNSTAAGLPLREHTREDEHEGLAWCLNFERLRPFTGLGDGLGRPGMGILALRTSRPAVNV